LDRSFAQSTEIVSMLHIVSWNVESATRLLADHALQRWHEQLDAPDIFCLQELRVRAHDDAQIGALKAAIPGWTAEFSLNRDPINARFRGGRAYGVGTWVRESLQSFHARLDWDREGRILITSLPTWRLVVVNVYAVNGTSKPYFDHELGKIDGDRHAFKRRLVKRLAEVVTNLQRNAQVVLIGDWNISQTRQDTWPRLRTEEPHATARREFATDLVARCELVDAFRALHPDERRYTWFNPRVRGSRLDAACVDFALLSRSLMTCLRNASIDDPAGTRSMSDHVPIHVTLTRARR